MTLFRGPPQASIYFVALWRLPGMSNGLEVKVTSRSWWRKLLANGKGVQREAGSEGNLRQNSNPRNTNRIRCLSSDEIWQFLVAKVVVTAILSEGKQNMGQSASVFTTENGSLLKDRWQQPVLKLIAMVHPQIIQNQKYFPLRTTLPDVSKIWSWFGSSLCSYKS